MKLLCFLISFTCITAQLKAQSIGLPHISNYSILDYRGGSQNWDIQQDHKGILYFANNEGLLTFNGGYWKLYPLPNRTIVRSVRLARNGRVYVGGQDELGYFFPDNNGTLQYTSLKPLIPKSERQFSDVWNIADDGRQMIFRTTDRIMCLKDGKMAVFKPASSWEFAGTANGRIIVQDLTQGLMVMNGGHLDLLCADPKIKGAVVSAVLPYRDDTLLVVTLKNGLFLLKDRNLIKKSSSAESLLVNSRIFRAIQVNRDHYALGTTSAALVIIDRNGDVVQRFTSADGLQKDNVRSIFVDRDKNLWVGLDNGIDYLAYNSAIKTIFPDPERQVSAYSTIVHGRDLYIGTSNGVFTCPLDYSRKDLSYSNGRFQEVRNTGGQVWSLSEVNGRLVMGHEDGAFVIDGTAASPVYQRLGTWLFQPLSPVYPSAQVIAGTYEGLESLSFDGNRFQDKGHIGNIVEPLRFLVYDPEFNTLWSSHPYRGIFRFVLSADKKRVVRTFLYSQKDGLPLTLYNYVFYVKNRIVVSTARGYSNLITAATGFERVPFLRKH
ncbi:two-component regulator propeller domain-containing protein [Arcticibacter sp. MXS-1]|uniref:two-component regulator propeller domain-containing protein n=1 Tax=Arcticibacter sp. MXS-1 TaxID=3341726 RepID=UPI0035A8483A